MLRFWSFWVTFANVQPLSWLSIGIRCIAMYLCFIKLYESVEKLIWLLWNIANFSLSCRHVAIISNMLENVVPTSQIHFHAKGKSLYKLFFTQYLSISFRCPLYYPLSFCSHPKQYGLFVLVFSEVDASIESPQTWYIVCACMVTFKFIKLPTNDYFLGRRCAIFE